MTICFDIGGSAIKAARVAPSGELTHIGAKPTPLDDFNAFCAALAELAGPDEGGDALSVAITGVADPADGRIKCANIPCIDGRTLAHDLSGVLGRPVFVTNDADCFALAEAEIGAGRGHRVVFGIILGTGVGGGVVVGGRLVEGAAGFSGEWGHGPILAREAGNPPVAIPPFPCGCGQKGCIDTIGGARGLERLHRHLTGAVSSSVEIMAAWRAGNPQVQFTLACYIELIAPPLAFCVNVLGADIVPVGGGLAQEREMLGRLDHAVRALILRPSEAPLVVPGTCPGNPGLVGAEIVARTLGA